MQISIVLVRPQLPENIGMAARAMQNCGLKKLIIVSPREKFPNQKAIDASAKANNIIKNAKVFDSLDKSIENHHYIIATTSRKRFLKKPHEKDFDKLFSKIPINKKIAIVFGPERSGLSNEDLMLCDCLFSIPISNDNESINLSHSVFLMSYKFQENLKKFNKRNFKKNDLSNKKNFYLFMNFLKKELQNSGFLFPEEKSESMFQNIQTIFLRAQLSKIEIQTLWGIIKTLKKTEHQ